MVDGIVREAADELRPGLNKSAVFNDFRFLASSHGRHGSKWDGLRRRSEWWVMRLGSFIAVDLEKSNDAST